ncbi:bacteriohemerythrin [Campylobacter sp. US33a]|uniref:bacteriohemerythrin n=1 Tax=Campylobacter sp. US33a TaxID=2498120 RepID=UPI00141993DC|nr:hemerythrin family protein [Campylobacter sp. US33a]
MVPEWDSAYAIGNSFIDAQHKKFFDMAKNVEEAFFDSVSREKIKELLQELFVYMKTHFKDEEELMKKIHYPKYDEHILAHKNIIGKMVKTIQNAKSTNDLKESLYNITQKWLLNHILEEDMQIEQHIQNLKNKSD